MTNKLCCNPSAPAPATKAFIRTLLWASACLLACITPAFAGSDAPQWMHALVNAPLPPHDDKTDAVLLYSETKVNVQSADKMKITVREAYKILRPDGRERGTVLVFLNSNRKVTSLHGWCIPAQGRDYEVKVKDAMEISPPKIEGAELIVDVKAKMLTIPAPDPGNIIGYEYEVEERPLVLQHSWEFQRSDPVRETHYSIQVPAGWEYKTSWLNHAEVIPTQAAGQTQWMLSDVKGVRKEEDMPPMQGLLGQMVVSFFPPGGPAAKGFSSWAQMGTWYSALTADRLTPSPEIKQKVAELAGSATQPLDKMRAIAKFVQQDIRYVAIELGIGGLQPHPAANVFRNRYGDCKDKAALMSSMLHEIGIDSYFVVINTERGSVGADTPAYSDAFNHAILAIKIPNGVSDPSWVATVQHPTLGKILYFDPTNRYIPFGQIGGYLQSTWGLLVTPSGGELVELPKQPAAMNSIERVGHLTLDASGKLVGEVQETRLGDRAWSQRFTLLTVTKDSDRVKPIENLLSDSLSNFRITKATVLNLTHTDQPFGFKYTFEAERYAKVAGNLLLVRPRVLGRKASGILETREPRQFPIEFPGPVKDTDNLEIAIPAGYEIDDLPPPVDADFSFASYHSKTEAKGNVIRYTRSFEVKELSVPVSQANELKKFYRIIASDERNTAVLKPAK